MTDNGVIYSEGRIYGRLRPLYNRARFFLPSFYFDIRKFITAVFMKDTVYYFCSFILTLVKFMRALFMSFCFNVRALFLSFYFNFRNFMRDFFMIYTVYYFWPFVLTLGALWGLYLCHFILTLVSL